MLGILNVRQPSLTAGLQPLINAKVVEAHEGHNEGCAALKGHGQRAPEHPPTTHQDAKSALDGHAIGALIEVKVIERSIAGGRDDHTATKGKGRITIQKEGCRQVTPFNALSQICGLKSSSIVSAGGMADVNPCKTAVVIADGNGKQS